MPGAFSGISMAGNALRYFQRAMETVGHNIANVNTPGYSRQTVEFKTSVPLTIYSGGFKAMGSGVTISAIERARNSYLEASARDNNGSLGRYQTLSAALRQIESSFIEPGDEGIAASLDKFFDAGRRAEEIIGQPLRANVIRSGRVRHEPKEYRQS